MLSGKVANQSDDCSSSMLGHQTSSYGDWWRIVEFNPALAHPWAWSLSSVFQYCTSTASRWRFQNVTYTRVDNLLTLYRILYIFIKPVSLQEYWFEKGEWILFLMMLLRIWWSEGKPDLEYRHSARSSPVENLSVEFVLILIQLLGEVSLFYPFGSSIVLILAWNISICGIELFSLQEQVDSLLFLMLLRSCWPELRWQPA